MATLTQRNIEYIGNRYGKAPLERVYPEASSQSFAAGALVYLASGKVTACADDAVTILGIAKTAASGTANTDISVQIIDIDDEFAATVYNATAASAITAVASVGLKYPIQLDSSKYYLDNTDQNTPAFVVQGIYLKPGETIGDIYGRYRVSFLAAVLQTIIGA